MNFLYPELLWILVLLLPVIAALLFLSHKRQKLFRTKFAKSELIAAGSREVSKRLLLTRIAVLSLGITTLMIALARPITEHGTVEFPQGTTDVMVLVDVSRSMAACEYAGKLPNPYKNGTRLDMARYLIHEKVIPVLGANRIGIVTYAGDGFPLAFLTNDVSAVDWVLERAMLISSAPGDGTSLSAAFALASEMFELDSEPSHRKIVVLFSDGGNDDGMDELNKLIDSLRKSQIELITVGLGKPVPAPIPTKYLAPYDQYTSQYKEFYEVNNEIAQTQLDENALRLLANRVGGKYSRIKSADDFTFESLSQRLEMHVRKGKAELFLYPLVLGTVLLIVGWFLPQKFTWSWRGK